jgi:hypothetical protein
MNKPTPRATFIQSAEFVKQHNTLLDSGAYNRAEDTAIAEFTRAVVTLGASQDLNGPGAQQAAAASFHMLMGAMHYLEVFRKLAEPYAKQPPKDKIESLTSPN